MATKAELTKLTEDLKAAAEAAIPLALTEDGGTCNRDSVAIKLRGKKGIAEAIKAAGLHGFAGSGWMWKGKWIISPPVWGPQGNARTRMVMAMSKVLTERGHDVYQFMQCD
jgi:hypothetical protein